MYTITVSSVLLLVVLSNVYCETVLDRLPAKYRDVFKDIKINENAGLDIYHLLRKYGYPVETHWVTTEDGYVLRMHRITGGQNNTFVGVENKPAALLMHGLSSSSVDWIGMGPKKGLGLALADAGYDVWLGNNRGNVWSRYHMTLDPDLDDEFWDFSFERCGQYDLPAKIDYILEKTGQQKIFYVGLSQGTTQFFAMGALRPEYNDKIALMSALAPVAYMGHLSSPIMRIAAKNLDFLQKIVQSLNIHEVFPYNPTTSDVMNVMCADGAATQEICVQVIFLLCGFDNEELDRTSLSIFGSHAPAGMSINMAIHYGQEIQSGFFRRYDYGTKKNLELYNSEIPPDFNISAITAPIALYYGQNDLLAAVQDVEKFASQLPNLAKKKLMDKKRWSHIDFAIAKDVYELVNKEIIEHQQEFIDNGDLTTTTTERAGGSGSRTVVQNSLYSIIAFIIWMVYL